MTRWGSPRAREYFFGVLHGVGDQQLPCPETTGVLQTTSARHTSPTVTDFMSGGWLVAVATVLVLFQHRNLTKQSIISTSINEGLQLQPMVSSRENIRADFSSIVCEPQSSTSFSPPLPLPLVHEHQSTDNLLARLLCAASAFDVCAFARPLLARDKHIRHAYSSNFQPWIAQVVSSCAKGRHWLAGEANTFDLFCLPRKVFIVFVWAQKLSIFFLQKNLLRSNPQIPP